MRVTVETELAKCKEAVKSWAENNSTGKGCGCAVCLNGLHKLVTMVLAARADVLREISTPYNLIGGPSRAYEAYEALMIEVRNRKERGL